MKLFAFLFGARRVTVGADHGAFMLNICMKYRYSYYEMGGDDEKTYVVCSPSVAGRLYSRLLQNGVHTELSELSGVPSYIRSFFSRGGLVVGALCAAAIFYFSQNYVWDIRIEGYDGVDEAAVIAGLADCGFTRGTDIRDFSPDAVENLFLRNSDEIGWISVNMRGTVAYVEVQKKNTPPKDGPTSPANIVAAYDGELIEIITYSGLRMVEVGEVVREGQLLISGAYGDKTPGLHITRAAGRVMARTFRELRVEIPFEHDKKVETGRVFRENFIIFFGNSIKLFGNYGNLGSTCDKIVEGRNFDFLGASLPLESEVAIYVEYETVKARHTNDEARALAVAELEKSIAELGAEQIVKRNDRVIFTDTACVIISELTCIENIASTAEFEAELKGRN